MGGYLWLMSWTAKFSSCHLWLFMVHVVRQLNYVVVSCRYSFSIHLPPFFFFILYATRFISRSIYIHIPFPLHIVLSLYFSLSLSPAFVRSSPCGQKPIRNLTNQLPRWSTATMMNQLFLFDQIPVVKNDAPNSQAPPSAW